MFWCSAEISGLWLRQPPAAVPFPFAAACCTVVFLSSGEASSASFQMLALFLVRKIPQNFTRVRLLVLSRTLVPSVLGTVFAASRYAVHLFRPL